MNCLVPDTGASQAQKSCGTPIVRHEGKHHKEVDLILQNWHIRTLRDMALYCWQQL